MPSPFPGMNPFLEQERAWNDFHESFMPAARDAIAVQVRPHFIAKINEHLFIHEMPEDPRRFVGRSDVSVTRPPFAPSAEGVAAAAVEAPAKVRLPAVDMERLSFIEIRDRDGWQLVTVIELLSPANKYAGPDREQYLAKRGQLLASAVHFVEIDLLRGGPRMPMQNLPECDYCVLVSRVETRPDAGCGRFGCVSNCPQSGFPCGRRTPRRNSTFSGCCTASTTRRGTRTTSTAASRNRN
jgi:hypothetical protein